MAYGLPYIGSKNRFAGRICSILPRGRRLVDLFAGGCAVSDCARQSGKWQEVLAIDADPRPLTLFKHCLSHGQLDWSYVNREKFFADRDRLTYAQIIVWGHTQTVETYVYSKTAAARLDPVLAYIGNGAELAGAPTFNDPRQRLAYTLKRGLLCTGDSTPYARLRRLEALGSTLPQLFGDVPVVARTADWRSYQPQPGDVVYADPPYVGTDQKSYAHRHWSADNSAELVDRLRSYGVPVYISEYTAPTADAKCVARWRVLVKIAGSKCCERVECLWRVA